ncbi:hypothetical protein SBA4_210016 [Candidatus Sulfopaludibacter sp. SbA4]|nr:hypothetical protein SBA4_210016 [Candidatus Sulfopaludibacter sp. SbA4]
MPGCSGPDTFQKDTPLTLNRLYYSSSISFLLEKIFFKRLGPPPAEQLCPGHSGFWLLICDSQSSPLFSTSTQTAENYRQNRQREQGEPLIPNPQPQTPFSLAQSQTIQSGAPPGAQLICDSQSSPLFSTSTQTAENYRQNRQREQGERLLSPTPNPQPQTPFSLAQSQTIQSGAPPEARLSSGSSPSGWLRLCCSVGQPILAAAGFSRRSAAVSPARPPAPVFRGAVLSRIATPAWA